MSPGHKHRGEPLLMMGALLCGWAGLRSALWEPPYAQADSNPHAGGMPRGGTMPGARMFTQAALAGVGAKGLARPGAGRSLPTPTFGAITRPWPAPLPGLAPRPTLAAPRFATPEQGVPVAGPGQPAFASPPALAFAHQLMWMAAVSTMPALWLEQKNQPSAASAPPPPPVRDVPGSLSPPVAPQAGVDVDVPPVRHAAVRRWSGDGWLLLRSGSEVSASGAALPTYGASQLGAVLRYRLDPGEGHQPGLYVRATSALAGLPGEGLAKDAALGLAARPLPDVPVLLAAEARVSQFADGGTHLRPAVMAISQVPPLPLPLGLRAEIYAAGGYVGGAAATGFAEGQVHVDHSFLAFGPARLRLGAGVWGGAQEGAARLDLGPSASLAVASGPVAARLAVDWRFRVAGDAAPPSGPALTLAAGF